MRGGLNEAVIRVSSSAQLTNSARPLAVSHRPSARWSPSSSSTTVTAALREVGQRLVRLRALARLGEMADRGDFDEFLDDKAAYRR